MSPVRVLRSAAPRAGSLLLAAGLAAAAWAAEPPLPAATAPVAPATEKTAPADPGDLGRGLRYCRLGAPEGDEPSFAAALAAPALVLDLRLAADDPATADRVRRAVAGCSAARPLFVLVGADTPAPLRALLTPAPGLLTVAAQDSGGEAMLRIATAPATDRAAAEALAAGRPPRELIEEKIEKTRFDEARLAQVHANGLRESDSAAPGPATTNGAEAKPAAAPPPLRDLLLQRAVFLHRALLALGRIPEHT